MLTRPLQVFFPCLTDGVVFAAWLSQCAALRPGDNLQHERPGRQVQLG